MKFTVTLLPQAERDLDSILAHLGEKSPQGGAAWFQSWTQTRKLLGREGDIYGAAPENADHEIFVQQINFKPRRGIYYRAIYTIRDNRVYVMHIRGTGQNSD